MNFELFTAKRIIASKDYKSSVSAPIIKIATVAIALGITIMMVSIAITLGSQKKIREKVAAFNGDIIITNFDSNESDDTQIPISKNQNFYPEFNQVKGISHIQVTASKGGVIRTETDFEGIVVKGVSNDFNWKPFEEYLVEGRLPNFNENLNDEVLISSYMVNRLGYILGDKVSTFFIKQESENKVRSLGFTIVGIYDSGFQQFDEQFMFVDLRHIQRLNKWSDDQIGAFEVFVEDFNDIQYVGNRVYDFTPSTLDTITIRDKYYAIFEWIDLFDFNVVLIIGIMILVASINMITALLVLILERTQMIGILKALGSTSWSIRKIFLYNAAYIICIGLFFGNIIGLGLLALQKYGKFITLDPKTYYVTEAPVYIDITTIVLLNLGTLLLCLIMLLIPSYLVSKLAPVKAIRFE